MKKSHYNPISLSIPALFLIACLWGVGAMSGPAGADDVAGGKGVNPAEAISISSDRLIAEKAASYAEFVGNVRATQGNTVVTAESLRIYYRGGLGQTTRPSDGQQDGVEKIVANGNVRILFDGRVAESDRAVYTSDTRILVLSGAKSSVTDGNNSVSGTKIIVDRNDERITVEGSQNKRVEAVIFSGNKGLN